MPAAFDKCRRNGGKIRTISGPRKEQPKLEKDEYVHICILNGKQHMGYVKKKEGKTKAEEMDRAAKERKKK